MAEPTAERTTSVTELVAERLYRARTVILSGEINQRLAGLYTTFSQNVRRAERTVTVVSGSSKNEGKSSAT